jgi:glycosyltransferase involved in cell wall biosynthesis
MAWPDRRQLACAAVLISPVCHSDGAGGAERYLTLLYPRLVAQGHRAHLIGSVPDWPLPVTPIAFTPKWSRRSTLKQLVHISAERRAVAAVADELGPGLFHAQFKREQIGLTDVLARRAPVVWTEHGRFSGGRLEKGLAAAYRLASRRVGAIVCVSETVAEQIGGIVGSSVRLEVVRNAIDTTTLQPPTAEERAGARAQLDVPADARVVAWVGRLAEGKLPTLAAKAGFRVDGVTLMAGAGPRTAEMSALADGVTVRMLGHLADPGVVYRAADVFLFTSDGRGEGFPYSLLEAAAYDLPIVVNAGSGIGDELRGAAVTVAEDSPQALADALMAAASHGESRAWACEHDLVPWAARHADIFTSLRGVR